MTYQDIQITARDLGATIREERSRFYIKTQTGEFFQENFWREMMFFKTITGDHRTEEINLAFSCLKKGIIPRQT